jgi:hypothetical protein
MIPHTLVLKPGLVIHSVYNGYWFWGRPSIDDLWHDLRAATSEIRPDWDLSTPGLREAWGAGRLFALSRLGPAVPRVDAVDRWREQFVIWHAVARIDSMRAAHDSLKSDSSCFQHSPQRHVLTTNAVAV